MTWVRRTTPEPPVAHRCRPPMVERYINLPGVPPHMTAGAPVTRLRMADAPAGEWNDLWRCEECGELWRVGATCDWCDAMRQSVEGCPRGGYHPADYAWRPARWWQRLRYRREREVGL